MKSYAKSFFLVSILCALALSGCGGTAGSPDSPGNGGEVRQITGPAADIPGERVSVDGGTFTRLSPVELRSMMAEEDFPLINVHIPFTGNIPGTDLSIPYNEIEDNLDKLPAEKDAQIVLYCLGGPMSFAPPRPSSDSAIRTFRTWKAAWKPGRSPATGSKVYRTPTLDRESKLRQGYRWRSGHNRRSFRFEDSAATLALYLCLA